MIELTLLVAIVVIMVFIWKTYFSKKNSSTVEEKGYSRVDEKISEVRGRLRALKKRRPRGIKIDIKKYSD